MQLSAPTLPYDPVSSLPGGLPSTPSLGGTNANETDPSAAFGELLTAKSQPAPTAPAASAADPGAVPFSLGLNCGLPAGEVVTEPDSSTAAGSIDGDGSSAEVAQEGLTPTSEESPQNADALAAWLAANGLMPVAASPVLPATPAVALTIDGAEAVAQPDVLSAGPQSSADGASPGARSAEEALFANRSGRSAQVRAAYSGNPIRTSAQASALGSAVVDAQVALPAFSAETSPASSVTVDSSSASVSDMRSDVAQRVIRSEESGSGFSSPAADEAISSLRTVPDAPSSFALPGSADTSAKSTVPPSSGATSAADHASYGVALVGISATADGTPENFAGDSKDEAAVVAALEKSGLKKSLDAGRQEVDDRSKTVGINVAKSSDAMTTLAPTPVRPSTDDTASAFSVPSLDFAAQVKEQPQPSASELASPARRTVESVLAVTDHFTTTGGQHGVNLKFMVSGVELAVRVEVRGGSVQTTFRTDSAELRAALAVQWQAVAATSDERSQRLAEPVFTSSSGRDALQSDHGSADQRGARQGQPAPDASNLPRTTLRRPPTVTTASVPVVHASLSTSGRLHTFA